MPLILKDILRFYFNDHEQSCMIKVVRYWGVRIHNFKKIDLLQIMTKFHLVGITKNIFSPVVSSFQS